MDQLFLSLNSVFPGFKLVLGNVTFIVDEFTSLELIV